MAAAAVSASPNPENELGNPEAPRNSGLRRTESKKALLKAIEDLGGTW